MESTEVDQLNRDIFTNQAKSTQDNKSQAGTTKQKC